MISYALLFLKFKRHICREQSPECSLSLINNCRISEAYYRKLKKLRRTIHAQWFIFHTVWESACAISALYKCIWMGQRPVLLLTINALEIYRIFFIHKLRIRPHFNYSIAKLCKNVRTLPRFTDSFIHSSNFWYENVSQL